MKFRSDFVTNSSSANYTLSIVADGGEGRTAAFSLSVSESGDMSAEDIRLDPEKRSKDIIFNGKPVSSMTSIRELCENMLMDANGKKYIPDDDGRLHLVHLSVLELAPITSESFIKDCENAEITIENIEKIIISNEKFGSGDSAMWVELDDILERKRKAWEKETDAQKKEAVIHEAKERILSGIKAYPEDNEGELEEKKYNLKWIGSEEKLEKEIRDYFNGKDNHRNGSYWLVSYSDEYTVEVGKKKITHREVLLANGT